jgi:Zn-finger nucleic acid-binding protein
MTNEEIKQRVAAISRRVRERHYRPPTGVTPYALEVCNEMLWRPDELYEHLLDHGYDFSEAYRAVYGPPEHEQYGDDWKAYALKKRRDGKSIPWIAMICRGVWGKGSESEILRLLSEDYKAQQRDYAATYRQRHREAIRERDRAYYERERENILSRRRERRRNK